MVGEISGIVILKNRFNSPAPSIAAASYKSFDPPKSAAVSKIMLNHMELHTSSTNIATL